MLKFHCVRFDSALYNHRFQQTISSTLCYSATLNSSQSTLPETKSSEKRPCPPPKKTTKKHLPTWFSGTILVSASVNQSEPPADPQPPPRVRKSRSHLNGIINDGLLWKVKQSNPSHKWLIIRKVISPYQIISMHIHGIIMHYPYIGKTNGKLFCQNESI